MMENIIPNISTIGCKQNHLKDVISFDKEYLKNVLVIGQVDKKFIAVIKETDNLLLLFDQHAVHERIRLEKLLKGTENPFKIIISESEFVISEYKNSKCPCKEVIMLFISQNDLSLLKKHKKYWNSLGLSMEFFGNGVNVTEIPTCLYNKFKENVCKNILSCILMYSKLFHFRMEVFQSGKLFKC